MTTHPFLGLGIFIFTHDEWKKVYVANCANHSMAGYANVPFGFLFSTMGIVCELMYIPFMIVMCRREFMQYSCYKFMFILGIIDMVTLPFNAIITGFQAMNGIHYCTNPAFFYVVGSMAISGWFGATMTCCVIAIDRLLSFIYPSLCAKVFSEKMMRLWIFVPLAYWIFIMFYNVAGIYSITDHAMHYDPWYGEKNLEGSPEFSLAGAQMLHINSYFTVPILGICYSIMCIIVTVKAKIFKNSNISNLQRVCAVVTAAAEPISFLIKMLYQSACICVEIFITATVYVGSSGGFLYIPEKLGPVEHAIWVLVHADTPIVYLLFNTTLRKAAIDWCKQRFKNRQRIHDLSTYLTRAIPIGQAVEVRVGSEQVQESEWNRTMA